MTEITVSLDELRAMAPSCKKARQIRSAFGDRERLGAADALMAGATLGDLLWVAQALARSDPDVHRRLMLWAADCAARVLPVFEEQFPDDPRPRDAIVAARKRARDDRDAKVAMIAARAAAAATAATSANAAASWAARAAAGAAADIASAAARAATDIASAAAYTAHCAACSGVDSRRWQTDRFVARMSADEPEDWPLEGAESRRDGR